MALREAQLAAVAQVVGTSERAAQYSDIFEQFLCETQDNDTALIESVDTFVRHAVLDRVNTTGAGLLVGRHVLADMRAKLLRAHQTPSHTLASSRMFVQALQCILIPCESSATLWDDELVAFRLLLAKQHEALSQWKDAAQVLQSITPDAARRAPDTSWAQLSVRIARLWLQVPCLSQAEHALKRANTAIHAERENEVLVQELWICQARVFAAQHRYYDAAARYMDLWYASSSADVSAVQLASLYALFAPPSIQRTHMLTQILRDPCSSTWPFVQVLRKASEGRFLGACDVKAVSPYVDDHLQTDGLHVWAEHNICAAARVFSRVSLPVLAELVGLGNDVDACESAVARLIVQGKLPTECRVDQVTYAVYLGDEPKNAAWNSRISTSLNELDAAHALLTVSSAGLP